MSEKKITESWVPKVGEEVLEVAITFGKDVSSIYVSYDTVVKVGKRDIVLGRYELEAKYAGRHRVSEPLIGRGGVSVPHQIGDAVEALSESKGLVWGYMVPRPRSGRMTMKSTVRLIVPRGSVQAGVVQRLHVHVTATTELSRAMEEMQGSLQNISQQERTKCAEELKRAVDKYIWTSALMDSDYTPDSRDPQGEG